MGLIHKARGPLVPFLMNNFSISTILLSGACLQSLLSLVLPFHYAFLPAFFLLLARITNNALITFGYASNPYEQGILTDKWTAQVPDVDGVPEKAGDKGVVVFAIGASSNHPLGVFAPGFRTTSDLFNDMFKDLEANAAKWGYLGKSSPLLSFNDTCALTTLTLTYWTSLSDLHAFAHAPQHREAWAWWDQYRRDHHDVGIYHETYYAPPGHWETIYENIQPFGLGRIQYPVDNSEKRGREPAGGLVRIGVGKKFGGMTRRMAREGEFGVPV